MRTWPAPAKLNLFLHIVGQREDGYHLIQTVIQFVDLCDQLTFKVRADDNINCTYTSVNISPETDLCIKAAQLLQNQTGKKQGADIYVEKVIPLGAGLGGGSSDAATTLLALNELWDCKMSILDLEQLSIELGADVPVFVRGHSCWVEGIGEQLTPVELQEYWFVVIFPNVHLNTREMFADEELTRNCRPLKIRDFFSANGLMSFGKLADFEATQNVFEKIARRQSAVERAFQWLNSHATARLTGSGSAVFAHCQSKQQADVIAESCANEFTAYVVKGLNQSPAV